MLGHGDHDDVGRLDGLLVGGHRVGVVPEEAVRGRGRLAPAKGHLEALVDHGAAEGAAKVAAAQDRDLELDHGDLSVLQLRHFLGCILLTRD